MIHFAELKIHMSKMCILFFMRGSMYISIWYKWRAMLCIHAYYVQSDDISFNQ